ncbi:thioester domain-containing protein, partial [Corynebacterium sp. CCM 8835]
MTRQLSRAGAVLCAIFLIATALVVAPATARADEGGGWKVGTVAKNVNSDAVKFQAFNGSFETATYCVDPGYTLPPLQRNGGAPYEYMGLSYSEIPATLGRTDSTTLRRVALASAYGYSAKHKSLFFGEKAKKYSGVSEESAQVATQLAIWLLTNDQSSAASSADYTEQLKTAKRVTGDPNVGTYAQDIVDAVEEAFSSGKVPTNIVISFFLVPGEGTKIMRPSVNVYKQNFI